VGGRLASLFGWRRKLFSGEFIFRSGRNTFSFWTPLQYKENRSMPCRDLIKFWHYVYKRVNTDYLLIKNKGKASCFNLLWSCQVFL
jgi:hypothetical protein